MPVSGSMSREAMHVNASVACVVLCMHDAGAQLHSCYRRIHYYRHRTLHSLGLMVSIECDDGGGV